MIANVLTKVATDRLQEESSTFASAPCSFFWAWVLACNCKLQMFRDIYLYACMVTDDKLININNDG